MDASGAASVDASMGKLLFDVALQLEDVVSDPVDVQHVLAAIILAARAGELDSTTPLSSDDPDFIAILQKHITTVFSQHGGRLGGDD